MPRYLDGIFQENIDQNVFILSVKAFIKSGLVPKDYLDVRIEFSPVDECSKIILKLLENNSNNSIYHILNDKTITLSELKALLKMLNCDILDVDFQTFAKEIDKNADEYTKEYIFKNNINEYSLELTLDQMANRNLSWSAIDINYIQNILNLIRKKWYFEN